MPTQSLQGGIHGGFPSRSPRRFGLDDVALFGSSLAVFFRVWAMEP